MKVWNVRTTSTTEYCPFCGAPIETIHVTVDGLYVYHADKSEPCDIQAEFVVVDEPCKCEACQEDGTE